MGSPLVDRTFNFRHRGRQTFLWVDLFDEAEYGADKLFFRGRFTSLADVALQVKAALLDNSDGDFTDEQLQKFTQIGAGNPVDKNAIMGIGLNRFFAREGMGIIPSDNDPYPNRALYAVHFRVRVKFHNDYAYIDFGKKWIKDEEEPSTPTLADLELLYCSFISEEDAEMVLQRIKGDIMAGADEDSLAALNALNGMNVLTSDINVIDNTRAFDVFMTEDASDDSEFKNNENVIVSENEESTIES